MEQTYIQFEIENPLLALLCKKYGIFEKHGIKVDNHGVYSEKPFEFSSILYAPLPGTNGIAFWFLSILYTDYNLNKQSINEQFAKDVIARETEINDSNTQYVISAVVFSPYDRGAYIESKTKKDEIEYGREMTCVFSPDMTIDEVVERVCSWETQTAKTLKFYKHSFNELLSETDGVINYHAGEIRNDEIELNFIFKNKSLAEYCKKHCSDLATDDYYVYTENGIVSKQYMYFHGTRFNKVLKVFEKKFPLSTTDLFAQAINNNSFTDIRDNDNIENKEIVFRVDLKNYNRQSPIVEIVTYDSGYRTKYHLTESTKQKKDLLLSKLKKKGYDFLGEAIKSGKVEGEAISYDAELYVSMIGVPPLSNKLRFFKCDEKALCPVKKSKQLLKFSIKNKELARICRENAIDLITENDTVMTNGALISNAKTDCCGSLSRDCYNKRDSIKSLSEWFAEFIDRDINSCYQGERNEKAIQLIKENKTLIDSQTDSFIIEHCVLDQVNPTVNIDLLQNGSYYMNYYIGANDWNSKVTGTEYPNLTDAINEDLDFVSVFRDIRIEPSIVNPYLYRSPQKQSSVSTQLHTHEDEETKQIEFSNKSIDRLKALLDD